MRGFVLTLAAVAAAAVAQQPETSGVRSYEARCAVCHGGEATGGDRAPSLVAYVPSHSEAELSAVIRNGVPAKGMPAFEVPEPELARLIAHLQSLVARAGRRGGFQARPGSVKLADGRTLAGTILAESNFDTQILTPDGKFHSLGREGAAFRERAVEPRHDWPSYDGGYTGNRYVALPQINAASVRRLSLQWVFPIPGAPRLEVTPVVVDGVMYVTAWNEAYAVDAFTGRQLWMYRQPRNSGILSEAGHGANRGVAIAGDRVFMVTDHAHLIALDRRTGRKLWDAEMGSWQDNYSATAAPLVVGDLVIAGVAGGEEGARGFLDAYYAATGERAWRFYTIPLPGEKLAETWIGNALEHGCGATWLTGAYDPGLDLLYWTTGNPCPDFNGDERRGDNLYTSSVLALEPRTGKRKWHFQFTPHDVHDWDGVQPILLIDEVWQGRPRKLLAQASRNGFFFVLDRTNGELLRATPFTKVNWAAGYGKDGRPILTPNYDTSFEGTLTCPSSAANWPAASYSPLTKLFYVRATDSCSIFRKQADPLVNGRYFGGAAAAQPGRQSFIRAMELQTGKTAWDYPLGPGFGRGGTLATAGGLVFTTEAEGYFTALDARTGQPLWHYNGGQQWWASPMTYMLGGKQYVAIAGSSGILAFALPEGP